MCFFFFFLLFVFFFFFKQKTAYEIVSRDWSSDVCSSDQRWVFPMVFCLGTEGSKRSLFRNGWFQCFSVSELKVPMVPYLEMGGSNGFLFGNSRFQWFPI